MPQFIIRHTGVAQSNFGLIPAGSKVTATTDSAPFVASDIIHFPDPVEIDKVSSHFDFRYCSPNAIRSAP